jgi:hypothetical protein
MSKNVVLPSKDALLDAMSVAKASSDGAQYLRDRFIDIINGAKMNETAAELVSQIQMFAAQITMQLKTSSKSWSGQEISTTTFSKLHDEIAEAAAETLNQSAPEEAASLEHQLNYAIDNDGNFVRGWA